MLLEKTLIIFALMIASMLSHGVVNAEASYYDEINKEESEQLIKFKDSVKRTDKTLTFKMTHSAPVTLTNLNKCTNYETCRGYWFIDYFKEVGFYLVLVTYYEGADYLLINDKYGKQQKIPDHAMLSPDKNRFASVSFDETGYGGELGNSILIWRIKGTQLIPEFKYIPTDEYTLYSFNTWKDNVTLVVDKFTYSNKTVCDDKPDGEPSSMTVPATVKLTNNKWQLNETISKDTAICH